MGSVDSERPLVSIGYRSWLNMISEKRVAKAQ
jgi:hypothetical protein